MKKYIDLTTDVIDCIEEGKYVEGSLHRDPLTGRIVFRAYVRLSRRNRQRDRIVCQLENGWLKESPRRFKFYNSVKKELGLRLVNVVMHRELNTAMDVMEVEKIMGRV